MSRGPYQGTWQPNSRPTVVHAPDAMVYINGQTDTMGCPVCKKKFDLSKYITSVQIDLGIDSVPGSASISLSIPRHIIDDFYFDGVPLITPMMEVEIFSKGYYLIEGLPQYYPVFWGLVTEVTDAYSAGEHTVTIACSDILKWWELCKMNINPAYTAAEGQQGRSIFGNVFFGMNPYDVVWTCANMAFGDVVVGTGSLVSLNKEGQQQVTFTAALSDIMAYWQQRFGKIRSNMLMYGVNGVAVRGDSVDAAYRSGKFPQGKPISSTLVRNANKFDAHDAKNSTQFVYDPTDPQVVAFRTQFSQAGQVNFWQTEYQTKLELANAAKESIGFEFYMDVTGDIVFKPPFFNLDVLGNKPVSWIQDIDIIDWNFSESESEVVTQVQMQGSMGGNMEYGLGEEATPFTSVTDYHLLRKYGWRTHNYNSEFMGSDPQLMFYHGMDILDRINSKRHRATITIPHRPELRLGFPVYVGPKDQMWYIQGISHNIAFGSRATTTLNLTARRQKFIAPKGIGVLKVTGDMNAPVAPTNARVSSPKTEDKTKGPESTADKTGKPGTVISIRDLQHKAFSLEVGAAAQIPAVSLDPDSPETAVAYEPLVLRHPKTGRILGYPNVVMVYTRPFANVDLEERKRIAGLSKDNQKSAKKKQTKEQQDEYGRRSTQQLKSFDETKVEALTKKYNANRFRYGLNSAGVFVYAYNSDKLINQFALIPSGNIKVTNQGSPQKAIDILGKSGTSLIRPVSDDRGFEVVGQYRYGRGVSLRDGSLILTGGKNAKSDPAVQVAMSGGLFETLTAQSQGLTANVSDYPNPADAVARMAPDGSDMQTAGIIIHNQDSDIVKYAPTETNFVDTAPIGSPEQAGVQASVEASQLSRALTLAEMSVLEDPGTDDDCACLVGRADLAFITSGYSIKTVNTAAATIGAGLGLAATLSTTLGGSSAVGNSGALSPGQYAAALFDSTGQTAGTAVGSLGGATLVGVQPSLGAAILGNSVEGTPLAPPAKPGTLTSEGPVSGFLKFDDLQSRVEDFMFSLYQSLDKDHYQYEQAIRGNLLEITQNDKTVDGQFNLDPVGDAATGDIAPPFNAANRGSLGDPVATALQGDSAKQGLVKSFDDFGKKLKNQTLAASTAEDLGGEKRTLNDLQRKKDSLLGVNQPFSTGKKDPATLSTADQAILADLNTKIAASQQKISELQLKLATQKAGG